jgi:hypothetical protein
VAHPSKALEALALRALKLDQLAKDVKEQADAAKAAFIAKLQEEDLFDKSTKAIGDVQTVFSPNRYFDMDTALALVDEEAVKESTVEVVDAKLLKQHMTPIEVEKCMKDYAVPLKLALKVNDSKDTE